MFALFPLIQAVTDHPEAVKAATVGVLEAFAEENAVYVELRSTPREVEGRMTKAEYVEAVLDGIREARAKLGIDATFLVSVDRRNGAAAATKCLQIVQEVMRRRPDLPRVVGVDLSGDPRQGDARDYLPLFKSAREAGLRVSCHLAEVPNDAEVSSVLASLCPGDRIGHGVCFHPETGGSERLFRALLESRVPVEVCQTSNTIVQAVANYDEHHLRHLWRAGHPVAVCTDDRGVFLCSVGQELERARRLLGVGERELLALAEGAVDFAFCPEEVKGRLRKKFEDFRKANVTESGEEKCNEIH